MGWPTIEDLNNMTNAELPGMWEEADFTGGKTDMEDRDPMHTEDSHNGDKVVAWADKAMFSGEPHEWTPGKGVVPQVFLLSMTDRPLSTVAAMSEMYKGRVVRDLNDLDEDTIRKAFEDVQKTHLTAPLEAVKLHFMIDGVDRGFTHQMVRQRTAVYAQESHRFAVVEDLPHAVCLPPSLHGTSEEADPNSSNRAERWRATWDQANDFTSKAYQTLVNDGMPQEDARGLLPTATATRLNYVTDLRNIVDHAGNRLCTQAQFHWRHVFNEMIKAIRTYRPPGLSDGHNFDMHEAWQFEAIADSALWRPVCYRLGHCPFTASFDRFCSIRDRIQVLGANGIKGIDVENPNVAGGHFINPAEWMLVPDAARIV